MAVRTGKYQARTGIHRFILGDVFANKVSQAVLEQLRTLGDRPLNSLVSRDERQAVYGFIDTLVSDLLAGERTGEWLAGHLRGDSAELGSSGQDHCRLPARPAPGTGIYHHSAALPGDPASVGRMLAEPPVRERIIRLARGAVENFIGTLGPLGAMASGFLNMDRLEGTLREYLTGREGEIRTWLENEEVQQHFSAVLTEQAEKYLHTPVARLLEGVDEEQLASICREVALQVLGLLRTPGVLASLTALLRDSFEEMLGQGERRIGDLSEQVLDGETAAAFGQTIAGETVGPASFATGSQTH